MKHGQNVCPDEILIEFENGSGRLKNSHKSKAECNTILSAYTKYRHLG